jgi:hypothetical protein
MAGWPLRAAASARRRPPPNRWPRASAPISCDQLPSPPRPRRPAPISAWHGVRAGGRAYFGVGGQGGRRSVGAACRIGRRARHAHEPSIGAAALSGRAHRYRHDAPMATRSCVRSRHRALRLSPPLWVCTGGQLNLVRDHAGEPRIAMGELLSERRCVLSCCTCGSVLASGPSEGSAVLLLLAHSKKRRLCGSGWGRVAQARWQRCLLPQARPALARRSRLPRHHRASWHAQCPRLSTLSDGLPPPPRTLRPPLPRAVAAFTAA